MENAPPLLLTLGLLVTCGLLAGLIAERLGLPRILAYVTIGMLFSPGLLGGYAGISVNAWSEPLTGLALGIIAYLIGVLETSASAGRTFDVTANYAAWAG